MSDPFADYAKKALSTTPDKLVGVTKTRAAARQLYTAIIAELAACEDHDMLDAYLASIAPEIAQFRAELDFLWEGDGEDFPGLENEITAARERIETASYQVPVEPEYQDGMGRSYQEQGLKA